MTIPTQREDATPLVKLTDVGKHYGSIIALTGISFSDADAGSSAVTATLSVPSGALAASSGSGEPTTRQPRRRAPAAAAPPVVHHGAAARCPRARRRVSRLTRWHTRPRTFVDSMVVAGPAARTAHHSGVSVTASASAEESR